MLYLLGLFGLVACFALVCFGLLCLLFFFDLLGFTCVACLYFTYLLFLAIIFDVRLSCVARSLACSRFEQLLSFSFENDISFYFFCLFIERDSFEKNSDFPFLVGLLALLGLAFLNCLDCLGDLRS